MMASRSHPIRSPPRASRKGAEHEAARIPLSGKLGTAKLALQVDVGFGDAITPEPIHVTFPTLLDFPSPDIRAYRRETVVAEKLHAMVSRSITTSRMKDFFDIWFLSREFAFDSQELRQAIVATFERRKTAIPLEPIALTEAFANDVNKKTQWAAFLSRSRVIESTVSLTQVVSTIRGFLLPEIERAVRESNERGTWEPAGPWSHDGQ
jgi:hypothetical protein